MIGHILDEQNILFKKIFDFSYETICLIDVESGYFLKVNDAATKRWGYSREELLEMHSNAIHPHQMEAVQEFSKSLTENGDGWTDKLSCFTKVGSILPSEVSASFLEVDGKRYIIAIIHDTSERIKKEALLQEKNKELLQQKKEVIRQRDKLNEQKKELSRLNQTKDKFFSIIAHDLKSPISSLSGYLNLLSRFSDQLSVDEIKNIAANLEKSVKNTLNLMENLFKWSSSQLDEIPYQPKKIKLNRLILENIELCQAAADVKKIALRQVNREVEYVWADENALNTIMRNLISNAIKFTYQGGYVEIGYQVQGQDIEIQIKDNGTGMSKEKIRQLFKIDTRQSVKGTASESGTGLGLILCKELVEKNKGKLAVRSKVKEGSIFYVTLPRN